MFPKSPGCTQDPPPTDPSATDPPEEEEDPPINPCPEDDEVCWEQFCNDNPCFCDPNSFECRGETPPECKKGSSKACDLEWEDFCSQTNHPSCGYEEPPEEEEEEEGGEEEGYCKKNPLDPRCGCLFPDTSILTEIGMQPIQLLERENIIIGYDIENKKFVETKVIELFERKIDGYYIIEANNLEIKATAEHPFYVGNNYRKTKNLKIGDNLYILVKDKILPAPIININYIDSEVKVYNIQVDKTNNYFANSILVHNKQITDPGGTVDNDCLEDETCYCPPGERCKCIRETKICEDLFGNLWNPDGNKVGYDTQDDCPGHCPKIGDIDGDGDDDYIEEPLIGLATTTTQEGQITTTTVPINCLSDNDCPYCYQKCDIDGSVTGTSNICYDFRPIIEGTCNYYDYYYHGFIPDTNTPAEPLYDYCYNAQTILCHDQGYVCHAWFGC